MTGAMEVSGVAAAITEKIMGLVGNFNNITPIILWIGTRIGCESGGRVPDYFLHNL
jgi:hypothetical protein